MMKGKSVKCGSFNGLDSNKPGQLGKGLVFFKNLHMRDYS